MVDFGAKVKAAEKEARAKVKSTVIPGSVRALIPDNKNPNRGTERGAAMIDASLTRLKAGRSIVVDRNNRIIAGNKTAESYGRLGKDDCDIIESDGSRLVVVRRTDLDLEEDSEARELSLADNRTSEVSYELDEAAFAALGEEVDTSWMYTGDEIADILAANAAATELLTDEDDVPEPPKVAVAKRGQVWLLGAHRLMCGDSAVSEDVSTLMGGEKADCVITDPPYNVALGVETVAQAKARNRRTDGLVIKNDKMTNVKFAAFLLSIHKNLSAVMDDGAAIYVFHADSEGLNFRLAFRDSGLKMAECCIWVKQCLIMGRSDYQWRHEPILYGWKPTGPHRWYSDRKQSTIWEFDKPSRNPEHPTMNPLALIEYPLLNSTKRGDAVLDVFGGSGTTLIACEKTGRRAFLMELDPVYCDVIRTRWELATGKKATLYGTKDGTSEKVTDSRGKTRGQKGKETRSAAVPRESKAVPARPKR